MPIDVSLLNSAARPLRERILAFLSSAPGQAFTVWEILKGVEGLDGTTAAMIALATLSEPEKRERLEQPYRDELDALEDGGLVRTGMVQFEKHYTVAERPR